MWRSPGFIGLVGRRRGLVQLTRYYQDKNCLQCHSTRASGQLKNSLPDNISHATPWRSGLSEASSRGRRTLRKSTSSNQDHISLHPLLKTLPVSSERQLTLQARQSQRQDVQSEAARETSARRFRVLEEAQQHGSRRVFVFLMCQTSEASRIQDSPRKLDLRSPLLGRRRPAPAKHQSKDRQQQEKHPRVTGSLAVCHPPLSLRSHLAQSPHVEKNPPPCQLMIPVESLPHWARLSYEKKKNLKSKTKQARRLKGGVRPSGFRVQLFFVVFFSLFCVCAFSVF